MSQTKDPILLDIPAEFHTERLTLRSPRATDAPELMAAIMESQAELGEWMPWANPIPTLEQEEAICRRAVARFIAREDLTYRAYLHGTETFVVGTGLHRIDWSIPSFEIGYWCRTSYVGQGFVAEAVQAMTTLAFDQLGARRVEIRCDVTNHRSMRVAERAGFIFEGTLHNDSRDTRGVLRDTRIYAKIRPDPAPAFPPIA